MSRINSGIYVILIWGEKALQADKTPRMLGVYAHGN